MLLHFDRYTHAGTVAAGPFGTRAGSASVCAGGNACNTLASNGGKHERSDHAAACNERPHPDKRAAEILRDSSSPPRCLPPWGWLSLMTRTLAQKSGGHPVREFPFRRNSAQQRACSTEKGPEKVGLKFSANQCVCTSSPSLRSRRPTQGTADVLPSPRLRYKMRAQTTYAARQHSKRQ